MIDRDDKTSHDQRVKYAMYKSAPLPFAGQKRMFLKHFATVLHAQIPNDGWTIIDAFGGSGLLSHAAKVLKPRAGDL